AAGLLEAARTLGASPSAVFGRVALPLARPAIAVGAALALMEALNDIGASEFLGVQTMTVAVYTTWVTRADLPGAAQIALSMLAIVVALLALERHARRRQRYAAGARPRPMRARRLRGAAAVLALALAAFPVLVGVGVPAAYLGWGAGCGGAAGSRAWRAGGRRAGAGVSRRLLARAGSAGRVAWAGTAATVGAGRVLAWALRQAQGCRRPAGATLAVRLASVGYAVP